LGENTFDHRKHFITVLFRQQVWCAVAVELAPRGGEIEGRLWVIVSHYTAGGDVYDCRNRDAARAIKEAIEIVLFDTFGPKDRVDAARIKIKSPGIRVVGWAGGSQ